jgi:hypothetical protein
MPAVATHFVDVALLNPARARGDPKLVTNSDPKWLGSKKRVERAGARAG